MFYLTSARWILKRESKSLTTEKFSALSYLLIGSASKLNLENLEVYIPDQLNMPWEYQINQTSPGLGAMLCIYHETGKVFFLNLLLLLFVYFLFIPVTWHPPPLRRWGSGITAVTKQISARLRHWHAVVAHKTPETPGTWNFAPLFLSLSTFASHFLLHSKIRNLLWRIILTHPDQKYRAGLT